MSTLFFKVNLSCLFLGASISVLAQEYTYDARGNLASDANKQIASIHYNHLNLVDTIVYTDGRTIIYGYLAGGIKLTQRVLASDHTLVTKKDYHGQFLYTSDTLREIQHDKGRLVPVTPGNNAALDYQYHLRDNLGNVRTTLTTNPGMNTAVATFESATANNIGFLRYENARRVNAALFDHTARVHGPSRDLGIHSNAEMPSNEPDTRYAQRLNGTDNERYGIARSVSVMCGDTVKLEVYAKYIEPNATNRTKALNTLLAQIATGATAAGTVVDGAGYATTSTTPFPFADLSRGLWTVDRGLSGPKAYLNWLIFNKDFTIRSGGYVQVSTAAKENGSDVPHERLAAHLAIDAPGYVYTYLSNEETTPLEVYFDDMTVTQVNGPVIQENDYDPFGMISAESNREGTVFNNFRYNGKELQTDFGLNWYDYGARMYDAALGRWHVADPLAEKYVNASPYNYALNNPVNNIDPDGREVILGAWNVWETRHGIGMRPNYVRSREFTGPPMQVVQNQARLAEAWSVLMRTPAGKAIAEAAEKSGAVIHVGLAETATTHWDAQTVKVIRPGRWKKAEDTENTMIWHMAGGDMVRTLYNSPLEMFDGMHITEEKDKDTYLISIERYGKNKYDIAKAIALQIAYNVLVNDSDTWIDEASPLFDLNQALDTQLNGLKAEDPAGSAGDNYLPIQDEKKMKKDMYPDFHEWMQPKKPIDFEEKPLYNHQ